MASITNGCLSPGKFYLTYQCAGGPVTTIVTINTPSTAPHSPAATPATNLLPVITYEYPERSLVKKFQPKPVGHKGVAKPLPAQHQIHGKRKGKDKRW